MTYRPVVLCILDGVGWGRRDQGDAVHLAVTPNLDALTERCPWTLLAAHGTAVGMPSDGDMGNSEVGHNAMGAGRIFDQGAKLVANAIADGSIWESPTWKRATRAKTLHLIGLASDGNVHSHIDHLRAMIERAALDGVGRLRVHAMTDGRDVSARSALTYIEPLEALLDSVEGDYAIGSCGGRMRITMDRYEADWAMVERGWTVQVDGEGARYPSASEAIRSLYAADDTVDDQYLPEFVVGDYDGVHDGDAVILFNFRGDRALEICQAFTDPDFTAFERARTPDVFFAGMMEYDGDLHIPPNYLVAPPAIDQTVGEQLEAAGLKTYAISETQKYGHVTFFFNGNRGERPLHETWEEVPSLAVPFETEPAMSAPDITDRAIAALESKAFDHIRINLANGDMVGHTGALDATIDAVECVDAEVGKLMAAVDAAGGVMLVTADHGNADQMFMFDKKTGGYTDVPCTSHSKHPVPFWVYAPGQSLALTVDSGPTVNGSIARVGASILSLFGIEPPDDYLPSLIQS